MKVEELKIGMKLKLINAEHYFMVNVKVGDIFEVTSFEDGWWCINRIPDGKSKSIKDENSLSSTIDCFQPYNSSLKDLLEE